MKRRGLVFSIDERSSLVLISLEIEYICGFNIRGGFLLWIGERRQLLFLSKAILSNLISLLNLTKILFAVVNIFIRNSFYYYLI